jgi:hypothetical protein
MNKYKPNFKKMTLEERLAYWKEQDAKQTKKESNRVSKLQTDYKIVVDASELKHNTKCAHCFKAFYAGDSVIEISRSEYSKDIHYRVTLWYCNDLCMIANLL